MIHINTIYGGMEAVLYYVCLSKEWIVVVVAKHSRMYLTFE